MVSLKSEATMTSAGPTAQKSSSNMGVSALVNIARLWPSFLVADVRNWCMQNLRGGELVAASLSVDWGRPRHGAGPQRNRRFPPTACMANSPCATPPSNCCPAFRSCRAWRGAAVVTGHGHCDERQTRLHGCVAGSAHPGHRHCLCRARHLSQAAQSGAGERPSPGLGRCARRPHLARRPQAISSGCRSIRLR